MLDKAASFLQMIRRDKRGRLKIYLGFAAGVGKTYQMLQEGHRLTQENIDVLIGVVETHGRTETAQLVEGLIHIGLKKQEYHGISVEEMDLEAILLRHPQVVLVDELAHTNAPGSRNIKRYQDVQDILAAGINVITTMNVQHLESLYNTVETMMNVKVRERVPDAILAEADQVINVDVSAEDLQKRIKSGKVYPMDRVHTALENFFQIPHLEQLRELTLREAASQIDFRRREKERQGSIDTTDQVMVCINTNGQANAALLRYGSRLAGRLNHNWYAVYIQTLKEEPTFIDATEQRKLSDTLTLANQLGATVFTIKAENVAEAITSFASEYRISHIILGKPLAKPFWKKIWPPHHVVNGVIKRSLGFNIILIDTKNTPIHLQSETRPEQLRQEVERDKMEKSILLDSLRPTSMHIWKDPITKNQALQDLVQLLREPFPDLDLENTISHLHERESQGSTFLNEGIALPHARIENIEKPIVAIGLSHGGILDVYTDNSIEIVFLLLSPKNGNKSHLQLLAIASRMMRNRALRNELRKMTNPYLAYEQLAEFEAQT